MPVQGFFIFMAILAFASSFVQTLNSGCKLCDVGMTIWNIWASSTTALRAEERGVTCVRVKRVPSDARSAQLAELTHCRFNNSFTN